MKQGLVINMLQFKTDALIKEFLENLESELDIATRAWKEEAERSFRGIYFSHESENIRAEVDKIIEKNAKGIIVYLKANAVALADSYGVGSLMTSDNPGLKDYMKSDRWNPARRGKTIVGRPIGTYTDLFGRKKSTSGKFVGKSLENRGNITDTSYYISPSNPSYALQIAENWLYKTYLPRAYKNAVNLTNFSKYLIES